MKKKIIYFGTPDIAAEILKILHQSTVFEIAAVVTNPDAPQGRKHHLLPSATKTTAIALNIPVYTPQKLDENAYKKLQQIHADIFIVVAYGKLFPQRFIDLPQFGTFNLHFSLLPQYRGASPVQSALLNGEGTSGFSIFKLVQKMDAGDIYVQKKLDIAEKNSAQVFTEMTKEGGIALKAFCEDICREDKDKKTFVSTKQPEAAATYCTKFQKKDGQIFPEKETSLQIINKYRAFFLWPGIFYIDPKSGKRIKFLKIQNVGTKNLCPLQYETIFYESEKKCFLKTADGCIEILEAQPEGKGKMSGKEFFNFWRQNS